MEAPDAENLNRRKRRNDQLRNLLNDCHQFQESGEAGISGLAMTECILGKLESVGCSGPDQEDGCTEQVALNSNIGRACSTILELSVKALNIGEECSYEPSEMFKKIKTHFDEDGNDFSGDAILKLLKHANAAITETPEYRCLYGAQDLQAEFIPKIRKQRRSRTKEATVKLGLHRVGKVVDDETTLECILSGIHDLLKSEYSKNGNHPIEFKEFVIETTYENTVMNVFNFSFLVKMGRAAILIEDNKLMVKPIAKSELNSFKRSGGENKQMVMSIGIEDWEKFKKKGYIQIHRERDQRVSFNSHERNNN